MGRGSVSKKALKQAEKFNETTPIGTPVRYWPGVCEGEGIESKTRSAAWVLGGHTAVVQVEDLGACIALSHVQRLKG